MQNLLQEKIQEMQTSFVEKRNRDTHSFAYNNEPLLRAMRALLAGFEVSEGDKSLIGSIFKGKPELQKLASSFFFGEYSQDNPIGTQPDFFMGTEQEILGREPHAIKQVLDAKRLVLGALKKLTSYLENGETDDDKLISSLHNHDMLLADETGALIIARNLYLKTIENALVAIMMTAESYQSTLTPSPLQDSAK